MSNKKRLSCSHGIDRLCRQPVLCLQLWYPPEVTFVAGDHSKSAREGDRRYAHVGVTDGSAQPFQLGPDLTVAPGSRGVESQYGQIGQQNGFDLLHEDG